MVILLHLGPVIVMIIKNNNSSSAGFLVTSTNVKSMTESEYHITTRAKHEDSPKTLRTRTVALLRTVEFYSNVINDKKSFLMKN